MNSRKTLVVFLFLFIQLGLSFYVFNYTTRNRTPTFTLQSQEAVSCFDISNWGDAVTVGTVNGTVSYFSTGQDLPQWVYEGDFGVHSIIMSEKGDYVLALDENHTISLFRCLSIGENTPKWIHYLEEGDISGIYIAGGVPAIVYMLATRAGSILLFSNQNGLIWEYSTGTDQVSADISFNGKYVAAMDADGWVYLFDIKDPRPIWSFSTGLQDGAISLSYTSRIAVGGADPSGGGEVYSLSLDDGRIIWSWKTPSPVNSVFMSNDGSQVMAYEGKRQVSVLRYTNGEVIRTQLNTIEDIEFVQSPPFGSYVLTVNSVGHVNLFFMQRQTPLWMYDAGTYELDTAISSTGDKVFVSDGRSVTLITNTAETGMIPGSRTLWGVCFINGLIGLSIITYMSSEDLTWIESIKMGYPVIIFGLFIGTIIGFIFQLGSLGTMVAAVSSATGSYIGFKREGVSRIILGIFASVLLSFTVSILYGLFLWFYGAEYNVLILIITSVSNGIGYGFIFGLLGTFFGVLMMKFHRPN